MRVSRVEIPLRRPAVLVPGEFLGDDGIAGVLDGARDELVADERPRDVMKRQCRSKISLDTNPPGIAEARWVR